MSELTVQERLIRYLKINAGVKIAKGTLCDLARTKMAATGEAVGRRLRVFHEASAMSMDDCVAKGIEHEQAKELLDGGSLEVERRGKNHCWYWYVSPRTRQVRRVVVENGRAKEILETVTA